MSTAPFARILLRYVAAALVTYGLAPHDGAMMLANDPDLLNAVAIAMGTILASVTEGFYALAKRFGWRT